MPKKGPKEWIVCDPYIANGSALVKSFDTEDQAVTWLAQKIKDDEDGYVGCEVLPRDEALENYPYDN